MALSAPMQPFLRITSSDNIVPCGNRKHFLEYCRTHSSILWTSTHRQLRVHRKMPERPSSIQRKCREISCCAQNSTGSCGAKNDSEPIQDSPWEGAIIYKRSASQTHYEYCTTLERLGLSKVSSQLSRSTASSMGIRVTRAVTDFPSGTPVQISVDVTRKKKNLKLDGIIRTFITLQCNRHLQRGYHLLNLPQSLGRATTCPYLRGVENQQQSAYSQTFVCCLPKSL
eukprot:Gb_10512 [translate_table: standard]